jgi:hypothetical protein
MNNKNRNDAEEWWALVDELREFELSRAMKDQESVIRQQIKMETLKYSQKTLRDCYILFVGRDYDDE